MLSPLRLRDALRPLYTPGTMPADDPVLEWVEAYARYANDALAGPTKLASPLITQGTAGDFLTALDMALRTAWMKAAWVGPGLVGVTTLVPPIGPFLLQNAPALLSSYDREAALAAIAQSIHTYTLSITVTVTTASGVSTVVTLA